MRLIALREEGRNPLRRSNSAKFILAAGLAFAPLGLSSACFAQTIIATVNNDPITNVDVEQRMKMLRVFKKASTQEAALQSVVDDRIKSNEADKYKLKPTESDINHEITQFAARMKIDPNALVGELQRAGVSPDHIKSHFSAEFSFTLLVQALNKGIEASEIEVRQEMAKEGSKATAATEYTVRQIILPLLGTATPATVESRKRVADDIRSKFTDCDTGVPMARSMEDVVVKNPITRNSMQISDGMRQVLEKTPVGHVTQAERSPSGIEMLALCGKNSVKDDSTARQAIAQRLLSAHYDKEEERMLKEVRSHYVIKKR